MTSLIVNHFSTFICIYKVFAIVKIEINELCKNNDVFKIFVGNKKDKQER